MALRATVCFRTYTRLNCYKLSSTGRLNSRLGEISTLLRIPISALTLRTSSGVGPAFGAHVQRWCFHRYAVYRSQIFKLRAAYSNGTSGKGAQGQGSSSGSAARLSNTERIKVLVKEYGTVAVVFHTIISLFSLGTCYLLVSNGLDVEKVLIYFNIESSGTKKGASTLAIAYVLHKVLLPLRATVTVASVPLIVRQLRARGWMKGVAKTTR